MEAGAPDGKEAKVVINQCFESMEQNDEDTELAPCPQCGGENFVRGYLGVPYNRRITSCERCGQSGTIDPQGEAQEIDALHRVLVYAERQLGALFNSRASRVVVDERTSFREKPE